MIHWGERRRSEAATVDLEMFRPILAKGLGEKPRWKGGRPGFDPVLKFRMLVLQSLHGLSLEQAEYLVRDRLSWMRFCLLGRKTPCRIRTRCGTSARR